MKSLFFVISFSIFSLKALSKENLDLECKEGCCKVFRSGQNTILGQNSFNPPGLSVFVRLIDRFRNITFSSAKVESRAPSTGIESYQETLERLAKFCLGTDKLSPQQMEALETYHHVVQGEVGKDGTLAKAGNYKVGQIRKIVRFLEKNFCS